MNLPRNYSRKLWLVFGFVTAGLSAMPLYQLGKPWLDFHSDHLVIYDCRLRGQITPIGYQYDGRVNQLFVHVGKEVKAGDIIAQINTDDLEADRRLIVSRIRLAKSKYKAEKTEIESSLATLKSRECRLNCLQNVASMRLKANEKEVSWIQKQVARTRLLVGRGSIAEAELDQSMRELQAFQSQSAIFSEEESVVEKRLAVLHSEMSELKARQADLVVLENEISVIRSQLAELDQQLEAAKLRVSTSGTVTRVVKGSGSSVRAGETIVEIRERKTWCEAWIDETEFDRIRLGANTQIVLRSNPKRELEGKLVSVLPVSLEHEEMPQPARNPVLQEAARICLFIELNKTDLPLVPGMTGRVVIERGADEAN